MNQKMLTKVAIILLLVSFGVTTILGTTWADKDFTCPVCKTNNKFGVVASYGTYIYQWPSKYQYLFWPRTDSHVLYSCKKCYLSILMWDFDELPKDKLLAIQEALKTVEIKGNYKRYTDIPMSQRLEVSEKIYLVLQKDDKFWCEFYRMKAYHYDVEKNQAKADEARKKALEIATRMLNDKNLPDAKKELLLISGAMKHFLRDDDGAINDLNTALKTKFEDKNIDKEKNENAEIGLSAMIKDYIQKIQSPQKPRLMQNQ